MITTAPENSSVFDQMRDIEEQISALKRQHTSLKSSVSKEQFERDIIHTVTSKISAYHGGLIAETIEENIEGFSVSIKISKARVKPQVVEPVVEEPAVKGRKGRKKADAEGDAKPAKELKPRVSVKELEQVYADHSATFAKALNALPASDTPDWGKAQVEEAINKVSDKYVSEVHWNMFRDQFLIDNGSAGRGKKFGRK
jgi:hypothetical protein